MSTGCDPNAPQSGDFIVEPETRGSHTSGYNAALYLSGLLLQNGPRLPAIRAGPLVEQFADLASGRRFALRLRSHNHERGFTLFGKIWTGPK